MATWTQRSWATVRPQIPQMVDPHAVALYDECGACGTLLQWHLEVDEDSYWHEATCACGYTYTKTLPNEAISAFDESGFPVEVEA